MIQKIDIDGIRLKLKNLIVGDPRPLMWFAKDIGVHRITLADFFYRRRKTSYETVLKIMDYLAKDLSADLSAVALAKEEALAKDDEE